MFDILKIGATIFCPTRVFFVNRRANPLLIFAKLHRDVPKAKTRMHQLRFTSATESRFG